jgi:hypothetical protein
MKSGWSLWLEIDTGAGLTVPVTDEFQVAWRDAVNPSFLHGMAAPEAAVGLIRLMAHTTPAREVVTELIRACGEHPKAVICVH